MKAWANAIGYQLVWFAIVLSAAYGYGCFAPLALAPFAAWYLSRRDGLLDARLMILAALIGLLLDSLLAAPQLVIYASAFPSERAAPLWIVTLWAAFGLTLRHSFRFLHGRPWAAVVLGAIGAPLAYVGAGHGWHAVAFPRGTWLAVLVLGAGWAIALPTMLAMAMRLERSATAVPARSVHHVE